MKKQITNKKGLHKNIIIFLAVSFLILSVLQLGIGPSQFLQSTDRALMVFNTMVPPVLNDPINILGAAVESMQVAIVGTVLGIVISLILSLFAAKNLAHSKSISYLIKSFAAFVRAVPALIWALLFIIAIGLGPAPGILALAVNSIGMLVKVYAESLEEMDMSPIEALESAGASKFQIVFQGIIPSIISTFIAWSVFRFDINIRYSAILGVVGAGGIGWELVRASSMARYDQALAVTIVIFIMVMLAEWCSNYLKHRTNLATIEETK